MLKKPMMASRLSYLVLAVASAGCAGLLSLGVPSARAEGDAKPSIKDIMKADHKGDDSLAKRVGAGKATPDDVAKLLADYKILAGEEPKVGSLDDWKERTGKLVTATEAIQSGDKEGPALFKAAVSCKACHELHKAKK